MGTFAAGAYNRGAVHARQRTGESELRALLRTLRGGRPQRAIAAAAGVSLSLYKKLESGRHRGTHLRNLLLIARTVGAGEGERSALIRLARPDLARMMRTEQERESTETSLRSLRTLASELLQTKAQREALRISVELLYASLQPDLMAFAFEKPDSRAKGPSISVGHRSWLRVFGETGLPARFPTGALHTVERDDVRIVYAPVRAGQTIVAVLGVASDRRSPLGQKAKLFLETVAALLEVRLNAKIPAHSD